MADIPNNPKDVLNMALENERQGHKLLSDARDACEDRLAKATFDFLAREEIKHMEAIRAFAAAGGAALPVSAQPLSKADAARSIKGIFEQFGWQYEQAAGEYDARLEAYRTAMEMERHGHEFYEEAARSAGDPKAREFYEFLAAEEIRHFEIIQETYEFLQQPDALMAMEERWMQM